PSFAATPRRIDCSAVPTSGSTTPRTAGVISSSRNASGGSGAMIGAMKALLASLLVALAASAEAQSDVAVLPVEQTPYHVPVFRNELVTVLNVFIPPHRTSGFHRHTLDTVGVLIADTPRTGQLPGAEPTVTAQRPRGSVNFSAYSRQENVHAVTVTG